MVKVINGTFGLHKSYSHKLHNISIVYTLMVELGRFLSVSSSWRSATPGHCPQTRSPRWRRSCYWSYCCCHSPAPTLAICPPCLQVFHSHTAKIFCNHVLLTSNISLGDSCSVSLVAAIIKIDENIRIVCIPAPHWIDIRFATTAPQSAPKICLSSWTKLVSLE